MFYAQITVETILNLHGLRLFPPGTQITTYFQAPFWQTKLLGIKLLQWIGVTMQLLFSKLASTFINWLSGTIPSAQIVLWCSYV